VFPGTYEFSIGNSASDYWKTIQVEIEADSDDDLAKHEPVIDSQDTIMRAAVA